MSTTMPLGPLLGMQYRLQDGLAASAAQRQYEQAKRRVAQDYDFLQTARERFQLAAEAEADWRAKAVEDLKFRAGDQWHIDVMRLRTMGPNARPCLTINQLPKFIRQVTNDQRQNRPAIQVRPVDNGSDPDTAKVFQGLIRHLEYDSDADVAYDTAFETAVTYGKGYWRICTDYEEPWSFQQKLRIERITNPFAVYLDPAGRRDPDYHRMQWAFVIDRIPKETLCQKYEIDYAQYEAWQSIGDTWIMRDECLIADYYYQEDQPIVLLGLRNNQTRYVWDDRADMDDLSDEEQAHQQKVQELVYWRLLSQGVLPLQEQEFPYVHPGRQRQSTVPIIQQCKTNGHAVLERGVWLGQYIPIVPVLGEEIDIEGHMDYRGVVRDAIDPQRMVNYWASMEAETIALAPKAPYIGTSKQFKNHEREWQTANTMPYAYLPYELHVEQGTVAPPPQRHVAEPPIQALSLARQQAVQDLYNTIGITPPDLGELSGEKSGRHAEILKNESQHGTSHYFANLVRAIRHTGRILLDLIPRIYVEPDRIVRILGEDGSQQRMQLSPQALPQGQQPPQLPPGIDGIYHLGAGRYDVVVEAGASYATKREAAIATLSDLMKAVPKVAELGAHLLVQNLDIEGADELARMLKKTLPPGLLEDIGTQRPEDQVMLLQAKLQQMAQQLEQLNAYGQQADAKAQQLTQENQQLQQAQRNKQGDWALQQREEQDKMALERERLNLEWAKFQRESQEQDGMQAVQSELRDLRMLVQQVLKLEQQEQRGEVA